MRGEPCGRRWEGWQGEASYGRRGRGGAGTPAESIAAEGGRGRGQVRTGAHPGAEFGTRGRFVGSAVRPQTCAAEAAAPTGCRLPGRLPGRRQVQDAILRAWSRTDWERIVTNPSHSVPGHQVRPMIRVSWTVAPGHRDAPRLRSGVLPCSRSESWRALDPVGGPEGLQRRPEPEPRAHDGDPADREAVRVIESRCQHIIAPLMAV